MYPQPNENGVYRAQYKIPFKLSKNARAHIALCEIGPDQWAHSVDFHCAEGGFSGPIKDELPARSWPAAITKAIGELKRRVNSRSYSDKKSVEALKKKCNELLTSLSVLKITDFKISNPTNTKGAQMSEKKTEAEKTEAEKTENDLEPIKKEVKCSEFFEHIFTPEEIKQMAMEFSEATSEKAELEEEAKSHAQYIKSQVSEKTATINRISQELSRGKRSINVKCVWVLNDPSTGVKTLYRLDCEPPEFVRTSGMTASDKQLTLEDYAEHKERTLDEKPITPVINKPYEGEVLTDKEVEEETGRTPDANGETAKTETDELDRPITDCPI